MRWLWTIMAPRACKVEVPRPLSSCSCPSCDAAYRPQHKSHVVTVIRELRATEQKDSDCTQHNEMSKGIFDKYRISVWNMSWTKISVLTISLFIDLCKYVDGSLSHHWRMTSSGMLRLVALVRTDVSEELSPSFITVTRIGELRKMLAVTSNRRTLRRNIVPSERASVASNFQCFS
jgi:hypothetical protein